jgi:hypothetical protein
MNNADMSAPYPLTATATFDLVTRTLVKALSLLGIEWLPIPLDQIAPSSEKGLYTWVIGRDHEHIDPLDLPVAYVGIGTRKNGGLRGRLLAERNVITDSAGHAHGRAMFRLLGSPLGGPVRQITGADISPIEETIRASSWKNKERGIQKLRTWLSAPTPDVVDKAEELCIRAAVHIGDTPPPLNGHHAGAWGTDAPCDWGGWAVAQRLAIGESVP